MSSPSIPIRPISHRVLSIAITLALIVFGGNGAQAGSDRQRTATDSSLEQISTAAPDEVPVRMQRPAKGYVMVTAYFEPLKADADMDVRIAIKGAAEEANKLHVSLVVTCHGADVFTSGGNFSDRDLANARLATISEGLIELGVSQDRIITAWGNKAAEAASIKLQGAMSSDHPTCVMETAIKAGH